MADEPTMTLRKACGAYQLVIDEPEDLALVSLLPDAHWVATSIPIEGLTCDPKFLELADSDRNGRIRVAELRSAQEWLFHMLRDRSRLAERTPALALAAIDRSHADGERVWVAARRVLTNLGQAESEEITLDQVRSLQLVIGDGAANGDGVIPPAAVEDAALRQLVQDILEAIGGVPDANKKLGVDQARLDEFLAEAQACLDWRARVDAEQDGATGKVMVWGESTPPAFEALIKIEPKIDEYFLLCARARFGGGGAEVPAPHTPREGENAGTLTPEAWLRDAPLAPLREDGPLPLGDEVNPLYRADLDRFVDAVLKRGSGRDTSELRESEWRDIQRVLSPYRDWVTQAAGAKVRNLDSNTLRACLDGEMPDALRRMFDEDRAVAAELKEIGGLEKLLLFQQWLFELANNVVNLSRLHHPSLRSFLEAGTLVMDGRRFKLCVRVIDRAAHKAVVEESGLCALYLEVSGVDEKDRFEVAAAVTAGEAGTLRVGKRGVFTTVDGREWDARVVDMVRKSIGLAESLKAPFLRVGETIQKQLDRFSTARYLDIEKQVALPGVAQGAVTQQVGAAPQKPAAAGAPASEPDQRSRAFRDLMVGGGIATAAVGALGSSFAYITRALSAVALRHLVVALVSLLAIVLVPTLLFSLVRLRRRSLTVFLEACGWALNVNIRLTGSLGRQFTVTPALPANTRRVSAERRALLWFVAAVLTVAAGLTVGLVITQFWGRW